MTASILVTGDHVVFEPDFTSPSGDKATVLVSQEAQPVCLQGSWDMLTRHGQAFCLTSDASSIRVENCDYVTETYVAGGKGTLRIEFLDAAHISDDFSFDDTTFNFLLLGEKESTFTARFEVTTPATALPEETSGEPSAQALQDPNPVYMGRGFFVSEGSIILHCHYTSQGYPQEGRATFLLHQLSTEPYEPRLHLGEENELQLQVGASCRIQGTLIVHEPAAVEETLATDPAERYDDLSGVFEFNTKKGR